MPISMSTATCTQCGKSFERRTAELKRCRQLDGHTIVFCSKACCGLNRRTTAEAKKANKKQYDKARRGGPLREQIKQAKAEYFQKRYADPEYREAQRELRKKRMPKHLEYCRSEKYKAYKQEYDANRWASQFGEFADAYKMLRELKSTIDQMQSGYDRRLENKLAAKTSQRKRNHERNNRPELPRTYCH